MIKKKIIIIIIIEERRRKENKIKKKKKKKGEKKGRDREGTAMHINISALRPVSVTLQNSPKSAWRVAHENERNHRG